METIVLTKHGVKRATKRLGIPKKAVRNAVLRAYCKGAPLAKDQHLTMETMGSRHTSRVYGQHIYVFDNCNMFITVLDLDQTKGKQDALRKKYHK